MLTPFDPRCSIAGEVDTIAAIFRKRVKDVSASSRRLELFAPDGLPEINRGDDLAPILTAAFDRANSKFKDGDVVVIAQKIISKSEGRRVNLTSVRPSAEARKLALDTEKDPRLAELILQESTEIVRKRVGLIIARHRNGCVVANAAIDLSNTGGADKAVLLPEDADISARAIAERIRDAAGAAVAVIINDSMGRAWRKGTTGTAIGCYGISALLDRRGQLDRAGNELQSSEIGLADEIAAAASLLMGQGDEGLPVVLVRGLDWASCTGKASDLIRPREQDLFV